MISPRRTPIRASWFVTTTAILAILTLAQGDARRHRFDYTVRMREFFDHHLKGAPAPDWWTAGDPRLDMEKHLKTRQPKPRKPGAPAPTPTTAGSS